MTNKRDMTAAELASLLEAKAKKLRETDDIDSVWGGEGEEGAVGGCTDCCGSRCTVSTDSCAGHSNELKQELCKRSCVGQSPN